MSAYVGMSMQDSAWCYLLQHHALSRPYSYCTSFVTAITTSYLNLFIYPVYMCKFPAAGLFSIFDSCLLIRVLRSTEVHAKCAGNLNIH